MDCIFRRIVHHYCETRARMTAAPSPDRVAHKPGDSCEGAIARCGLALANWSERWFPDPLVFAFIGIVVVFLTGLLLRESPSKLAIAGGKSFWSLVPFTMQMVMIIIGGYVVASTPAGVPRHPMAGGHPQDSPQRDCAGGTAFHVDIADLLGTEPDFQRPLRARAFATREGPGLPRRRSRRLSRPGCGLGHGTLLVGGQI